MQVYKKRTIFVIFILCCIAICLGNTACSFLSPINGTYYQYENEQYTSFYIQLNNDGSTKVSNGSVSYEGVYTIEGTEITLTYYNPEEPEETNTQTLTGTISDGVITIIINGFDNFGEATERTMYFYKKEKAPSSTPNNKTNTTVIDGITYELTADETAYFVKSCDQKKQGDLVILAEIDGKPVTYIGSNAFTGCSSLTSVTIPDSVTSIEFGTFSGCSSLTTATIPDSVTSIGDSAFYGCSSLTSVTIPDSVTSIEFGTFSDCSSLTSITIPDSITSINHEAFQMCDSLKYNEYDNAYYLGNENNPHVALITVKSTYITSCAINENTKIICDAAFLGCSQLTSISIPNSVTSIGAQAFSNCSSLTSITIPDSVTSIGGAVFWYCSRLTSVTIPDSITSIGDYAFRVCSSLTSVTIPDSVTSIGSSAFSSCSSLTSIIIPDEVTSIGDNAFSGCSSLTSVTIPDSITSIGNKAFDSCNNLKYNEYDNAYYLGNENNPYVALITAKENITSCTINGNTKIICDAAFALSWLLTGITIPDSVTSIGNNAFSACHELTSITISDSVTSIGNYAFERCEKLTSVTIGNSVTSIGYEAFYNCYNLKYNEYDNAYYLGNKNNPYVVLITAKEKIRSCSINENAKIIYNTAFDSNGVTSIIIPDSVTSIGQDAFSNCSGLTSVTIGNNVTSIGNHAFMYCKSLSDITFNGTMAEWNAIQKGAAWNSNTNNLVIHCTDGDVKSN